MTERTITVEREVIEQASLAVRETAKALITLEETLKQPYPDDPRRSPWTLFIDRNEYSPWSLLAKADTALKAALSSDHRGARGELEKFRERKDDCGVCGVPGTNRREVCEGYSVPRCDDHRDLPAYQAESRLDTLLSDQPPAPRGLSEEDRERLRRLARALEIEGWSTETGSVVALLRKLADQDGGS